MLWPYAMCDCMLYDIYFTVTEYDILNPRIIYDMTYCMGWVSVVEEVLFLVALPQLLLLVAMPHILYWQLSCIFIAGSYAAILVCGLGGST